MAHCSSDICPVWMMRALPGLDRGLTPLTTTVRGSCQFSDIPALSGTLGDSRGILRAARGLLGLSESWGPFKLLRLSETLGTLKLPGFFMTIGAFRNSLGLSETLWDSRRLGDSQALETVGALQNSWGSWRLLGTGFSGLSGISGLPRLQGLSGPSVACTSLRQPAPACANLRQPAPALSVCPCVLSRQCTSCVLISGHRSLS